MLMGNGFAFDNLSSFGLSCAAVDNNNIIIPAVVGPTRILTGYQCIAFTGGPAVAVAIIFQSVGGADIIEQIVVVSPAASSVLVRSINGIHRLLIQNTAYEIRCTTAGLATITLVPTWAILP